MLPGVSIIITTGGLGKASASLDRVAGLILSASATDYALPPVFDSLKNKAHSVFSLSGAEELGITAQFDTDTGLFFHRQIKDFYTTAGKGKELWLWITDKKLSDFTDGITSDAFAFLSQAQGRIRVLALYRQQTTPSVQTNFYDADALLAVQKLELLAQFCQSQMMPFRAIIPLRDALSLSVNAEMSLFTDFRKLDANHIAVSVCGLGEGIKESASGLILGSVVASPVQRKISRVKNGAIPITTAEAYLTDGKSVNDNASAIETLHDKGVISFRTFVRRAGFYYSSIPACTALDDDFAYLNYGFVIDKGVLIAYDVYVNEIDEEVKKISGKPDPAYIAYLEKIIEDAINQKMTADNEISSVSCYINPDQNLTTAEFFEIELSLVPVDSLSNLKIKIGFTAS